MSLLLMASNLLERLKQRTVTLTPTAPVGPPKTQTPRQLRDRLRQEIRNRGARPEEIETIPGDCNHQVATQIENYTRWLASH